MDAFVAPLARYATFLPIFAIDATAKKNPGNSGVKISRQVASCSHTVDQKRNLFDSRSKFFPKTEAYTIPPSCPTPSLMAQFIPADNAPEACIPTANSID
ncbi:hypothetical protein AYI70_g6473 [Smittium culicis]|uniref:Uncharacterized protein n=1 Tax=Smittium culicis TaxID=133412 RepID=A0A1R1XPS2_9FUNG|nr:hypothetical protein AYI70_g6473 [Smittium culicis]